jgi:poly-gamma-glutamate synthase PgsB/CapB
MPLLALTACLGVLLLLGALERLRRDRDWRAVPIRIHVNGTRGKSTVTRLIWSGLREAGIPAIAKTTGTAPRILLPDGTERPVARRAPPSIREQLELLRAARRHGATALVAECMALDPELQWVAEHRMVRATIGVITNVRPDHVEVMGDDVETIAASLSNTVPRGGVLVSGAAHPVFEERAGRCGTRVVKVDAATASSDPRIENEALALAVLREIGVRDGVAARGFARAPRDPGSITTGSVSRGAARRWFDASAANDPVSLERLVPPGTDVLVVYNHRVDRGPRLRTFLEHGGIVATAPTLVLTGARPALTLWRAARRQRGARRTVFVPTRRLGRWLAGHPGDLVFCGNTRGLDVGRVLGEAEHHG